MIKRYIFILIILLSGSWGVKAQVAESDKFITVWNNDDGGTQNIFLPFEGKGYTIEYQKQGDPTTYPPVVVNEQTGLKYNKLYELILPSRGKWIVKVYANSGGTLTSPGIISRYNTTRANYYYTSSLYIYTSAISYTYKGRARLLEIRQWGTTPWIERFCFPYCKNMVVTATDVPNLSQTNSLKHLFADNFNLELNPSINNWDVSTITNMEGVFYSCKKFNQPLEKWNVENVTTMYAMFYNATSFNQPLEKWNVKKVTKMPYMFCQAKSFNRSLEKWNVENVTTIGYMFSYAKSFNQPLEKWNVENITYMYGVFAGATSFNQPLEKWNVEKVIHMNYMFDDATLFNQPLEKWNVENVTKMNGMFRGASSFNQPLEKWNVENVTDMGGMFYRASSFNQPLEKWNIGNVTDMANMFNEATSFNQPLEKWNVENVTKMNYMFNDATLFNQPLEKWNVENVTDMFAMFWGAESFNQPLEKWNVEKVTNMANMFNKATSFNQPLEKWDVEKVTKMYGMFQGASSFNQPLENWNVGKVTKMNYMFQGASSFNQPLENWNVGKVTKMNYMFEGATSFNQPLEKWNVENVTEMHDMFRGATSFNQPLEKWNIKNVIGLEQMFQEATSFNQPLGKWNIEKVIYMKEVLANSGLSSANYDATLIGWAKQNTKNVNIKGQEGMQYCLAENARNKLKSNGWDFERTYWSDEDTYLGTCKSNQYTLKAPKAELQVHTTTAVAEVCSGSKTEVTVTITGGTPPYSLVYPGATTVLNNKATDPANDVPTATHTFNTGELYNTTVFNASNVRVSDANNCTPNYTTTPTVTVHQSPTTFDLAGAVVCSSGTATVRLSGSETGVNYQLQKADGTAIGTPIAGSGNALEFTVNGGTDLINNTDEEKEISVQVVGTSTSPTACSSFMNNPAKVLHIGALKTDYTFEPAGTCKNNTATIRMNGSQQGVSYQLQKADGTNVGSPVQGTGEGIYFNTGNLSATTDFKVVASVSGATGCTADLDTPITVAVYEQPEFTVSSQDPQCKGASDGTLKVTPTAGKGALPLTYELLNLETFETKKSTPQNSYEPYVFTGLKKGEYSIRVTDAKGCLKAN